MIFNRIMEPNPAEFLNSAFVCLTQASKSGEFVNSPRFGDAEAIEKRRPSGRMTFSTGC